MKLYSFYIMFFLILIVSQNLFSQNTIKGNIIDNADNLKLFGVNIYIPELNLGTISNENGEYKLENIPNGKFVIKYSYLGYNTELKELALLQSNIKIDIKLKSSIIKTQEIVITGGAYTTQHQNAIKIETIKVDKIASSGATNLSEAMSQVPAVDIISKGAGIGKPVIRGLSMNEVLILNNGVRSENQQWSADHPLSINELGIEKIEIIKGPASLLYGSDAIGGVINLIKEKPISAGKIAGKYSLNMFSNTQGIANTIAFKGASNIFNWGVWAGQKSHSDYIDGKNIIVPNSRFNEKTIKTNLGYNKSKSMFKIFYEYNHEKLGLVVPPVLNLEQDRQNDIWFQDLTNQLLSSRNKFFLNKVKFEINAAFQNNLRILADKNIEMNLSTFTYESKICYSVKNINMITGLQGLNQTNVNIGSTHVTPDAAVSNYSIFNLAQYNLLKKLNIQTGIRFDIHEINTEEDGDLTSLSYKESVNNNLQNFSYSLGGTYNLTEQVLFRANIASGFRSPNIAELTSNGQHGVRYEVGNANLTHEQNFEADISTHLHYKHIAFDLAIFNNQINDYIFLSPTNDTIFNGSKIYKYQQSDAQLYGGEIGFHIHPHPLDWLHLIVTYSTVTGIQTDGKYLPFIPANKIKTELKAEKEKFFTLSDAFIKFTTVTAFAQNNPSEFETSTNRYSVLNASVGAKIKLQKQEMNIGLNIKNILNIAYIDHLSTLKDLGYYNSGRNINLYINIPFGIT